MHITIDKAGRLVIPKSIREQAGLSPGAPLEVRYRDGRIEIEPRAAEVKILRKDGFWVADHPGAPTLEQEPVDRLLTEIRKRGL